MSFVGHLMLHIIDWHLPLFYGLAAFFDPKTQLAYCATSIDFESVVIGFCWSSGILTDSAYRT